MKHLPAICRVLFLFATVIPMNAAGFQGDKDLDNYKFRVDGAWFYSNPSGTFAGVGQQVPIDIQKDLHFTNYSTFIGKVDWRFTRKNHLLMGFSPAFDTTKTSVLTRTINFNGYTYQAGVQVSSKVNSTVFTPGYRYDLIRRDHGAVGLDAILYMFNNTASLTGIASITGTSGTQTATRTASGSLFSAIPTLGPSVYFYPLHDSKRLTLEGNVLGMYLFGYGNFIATHGTVGIALSPSWNVRAGYQLASRLHVNGTDDRLSLRLTQTGPTVGIEWSGGKR